MLILSNSKTEVLRAFKEYYNQVTNRFNRGILRVRCDRCTEYLNKKFYSYFEEEGIQLEPTIGHCPQKNGKAECMNRTLVEITRTILYESKLSQQY